MTAVADIFDRDCDGYIDYYEFVAALHPNKDAYRPTTDADKIEDEVRTIWNDKDILMHLNVTKFKCLYCRSPDKWPNASVRRGFKWSRSERTSTG